ncbi:MAG: AmmeMemoRadiSam system protein B [Patescibacteria group bacterium]|nr:AmmeMemoRadiSam system protein B [Patescibacteria group bacterium]
MEKIGKIVIYFLLILFLIQIGILTARSSSDSVEQKIWLSKLFKNVERVLPNHYSYFSKKEFFDEAYQNAKLQIKKPAGFVSGGIIPHHLIVKDKIAAFFAGIEGTSYETVVLIGPNHFSVGESNIISSVANWKTPYGVLEPDLELIDFLRDSDILKIEEKPFVQEHSISGLVSFVKKSFPNAKFVPVILKVGTSEKESEVLASVLSKSIEKKNVLVISSVDFSHYQPVSVADFHDEKSRAVIESFDFERVYDLEIDSPSSIYVLLKYLDLQGFRHSENIFSTNSGRLVGLPDEPTTSHNLYYFSEGEKTDTPLVNFLFLGDLMLDRHVAERIDDKGIDYIFEKLAGDENRFFQGIDVVGANLEGVVSDDGEHYMPQNIFDFAFGPEKIFQIKKYNFNFFNLANNHFADQGRQGEEETRENLDKLDFSYVGCRDKEIGECSTKIIEIGGKKIGMAGFSMVYGLFDQEAAKATIEELRSKSDFVITNVHWGVEYQHNFNQTQRMVGHELIDAGSDVIIGHHPHVVQGMEMYKGKPIFYSLGNFVFDQYFSKDTQEGLAIGISYESDKLALFLYPLKSNMSQIDLMLGKEKNEFLQNFISWSSGINQIEEIQEGRIVLKLDNNTNQNSKQ